MNIAFIGQKGLTKLSEQEIASPEYRAESMAVALTQSGHNVTIIGTKPYITGNGNFHGVKIIAKREWNKSKQPGWLYLLSSILSLVKIKPDVIHLQSWRAARLLPLIRFLNRNGNIVWTIDGPARNKRVARRVLKHAEKAQIIITAPSRYIQYRLLNSYGARAIYVPDGYNQVTIPSVSISSFRLKESNYHVVLGGSPEAIRSIAKAHQAAKIRQRLIVLQANSGPYKRIATKFKKVRLLGQLNGRQRLAVINNAASVVLADETTRLPLLLAIMEAKLPIFSVNNAIYQETLGTTAEFFAPPGKNSESLTKQLKDFTQDQRLQTRLSNAARKRARKHFAWRRIVPEYLALYSHQTQAVPIDSLKAPRFTQLPV